MSTGVFFAAVGGIVLAMGIARLLTVRDWVLRLLALNVARAGALVVLVALAGTGEGTDPIPHALVLTGIVIMVAVTAVGLALAGRVAEDGDGRPPDE